jgi:hypothetical protein
LSRSATATSDQAAGRIPPAWAVPLLLSAVALVYTLGLDRPPHPDEL